MRLQAMILEYLGKKILKKQASILKIYAYAGAVWITLQEPMLEDIKAYKITFRP